MLTASARSTTVYRRSAANPAIEYPVSPVEANLEFRFNLLRECEADPNFAREIEELCHKDTIFWLDTTAWTKDTRKDPAVIPFICYDFQILDILQIKKAVREGSGDIGVEKSRDMGWSWMVLYVFQHEFQFEEGSDFRVGSRKEEFVDKHGVIDTLIEKIRFNLSKQPMFLMPAGFETEKDFDAATPWMRLINKANQNTIIGESANPHFGSGGRSRAILLDEFAKWEKGTDTSAWTSTADVTRCRIVISTPVGSANKFAQLMRDKREKITKITSHWTLHPEKAAGAYYLSEGVQIPIDLEKNPRRAFELWKKGIKVRSPWYDAEAERRTDSDLGQEVDIDYHTSGSMFFNSRALAAQQTWTFMTRTNPEGPIPYGRFIRAKIVEVNDTVKILEQPDGWLRIYELPRAGHQYTCGADSAEGLLKGDESFGVIIDKSSLNVVAAWNYHKPPEDFAKDIQLAVWYYLEADAVPENNNHGYTTCKELESKSHVKLYHARDENGKPTDKRGFSTNTRTRPLMLDHGAHLVDKAACELRDEILIGQCENFIKNGDKGGKPEANGDFLDDGVLAWAIAQQGTLDIPFEVKKATSVAAQREAVTERQRVKNAGHGFKS